MANKITSLHLEVPVKTVSETNTHEYWTHRHKRVKAQRREIYVELKKALGRNEVQLPCLVVLTRTGPRELDSDNLWSSLKAIRDEIASVLGVQDHPSSPVQFECKQDPVRTFKYKVGIDVQSV